MSLTPSPEFSGPTLVTPDTQRELRDAMHLHTSSNILKHAERIFPKISEIHEDEAPLLPPINAPIDASVDDVQFRGSAHWLQEGTRSTPTLRLAATIERGDQPGIEHDFEFHAIPDGLTLVKYIRLKPARGEINTSTTKSTIMGVLAEIAIHGQYADDLKTIKLIERQFGLATPSELETQQLIKAIKGSRPVVK